MRAPDFILLVRHGSKVDNPNILESELPLSDKGRVDIAGVASSLASEILVPTSGEPAINIGEIWHATTEHARQTAEKFRDVLKLHDDRTRKLNPCCELDPKSFWPASAKRLSTDLAADLQRPRESGNAILVAGHSPQLDWIAEALTGVPVAIARSEMVCIRLTARRRICWTMKWWPLRWSYGHLLWTIAPSDNDTKEQILAKIRSKMETAKLLGALMATVLGWILGSFLDPDKLSALRWESGWAYHCLRVSALFFFVAIVLYLATMYAYDSLLMPSAFWSSKPGGTKPEWLPRRPPSSDRRVLFHNMMHVWYWLFTPATVLVLLGLLVLAASVFRPAQIVWWVLLVIAIILFIVIRKGWPRHGAQD